MHAVIVTLLALSGAAAAAPAVQAREPSANFGLRAFSSGGKLTAWALVNAHVGAGINAIQIQRPAAFVPDPAYLDDTKLFFDLDTEYPWGVFVPEVPAGTVGEVLSRPGDGVTGFAVQDNELSYNGSPQGFWACSVNNVFTLFYGQNPDPSNLPAEDCLSVTLQTSE